MLVEPSRITLMKKNFTKLRKIHEKARKSPESTNNSHFEVNYHVTCSQIKNFQLQATAGEHAVTLDEPHNIAGDNTAMNAVQMLLSAFASCYETNWLFYITAYNLDVEDISVSISAVIDRRYSLGVTPARLKSMVITSKLISNETREKIEHIGEKAKKTCVVGGSLHPDIEKIYKIEIFPPKSANND